MSGSNSTSPSVSLARELLSFVEREGTDSPDASIRPQRKYGVRTIVTFPYITSMNASTPRRFGYLLFAFLLPSFSMAHYNLHEPWTGFLKDQ